MTDAYELYPCLVDDAPASIYVNVRYEGALIDIAVIRYQVTFAFRDAGPHGIGSADEGDVINAIEEELIAIARELGVTYVGRVRNRGTWDVTFYGPLGHAETLRTAAIELAGERRVAVHAVDDPTWEYYRELLLPDAERRRWIDDRRLVEILQEQGDRLTTPRRVDHWVFFATATARDAFVTDVERKGFAPASTAEVDATAGGDDVAVRGVPAHVVRTDPIELDHIHDVVMILVDVAAAHGGTYDRWESSIESGK